LKAEDIDTNIAVAIEATKYYWHRLNNLDYFQQKNEEKSNTIADLNPHTHVRKEMVLLTSLLKLPTGSFSFKHLNVSFFEVHEIQEFTYA